MFDFRYHALSLVAVLVALVIGLLLGVAVGDKELVSSAKNDLASKLSRDVENAHRESADLRAQLRQRQDFEEQASPVLAENQLAGQRVGLIFMGGASRDLYDNVRDAVEASGAQLTFSAGVREPPDLDGLAGRAAGTRYADLNHDADLIRPFAARTGRSVGLGGQLARRARSTLFDSFSGELDGVDAVVIARMGEGPPDDQAAQVRAIEDGLVAGFDDTEIPVVGAERTDTKPSHVSWYRDRGLASVDDVDDVAGRVALVYALAGRADGAYGVKGSAEGILPRVVEGQSTTTTG